jgi:pimeloyl-ACP methyl ester carboxylesterase
MQTIVGEEHQITSKSAHDGTALQLYLWEKREEGDADQLMQSGKVVLLVHGSRRSGHVAFDLPVKLAPGEFTYSFMDALALAGYDVFSLDLQCYGRSDHHPSGLKVTTEVAAADIAAAVTYICKLREVSQVDLIGWSWGATTTAIYAEHHAAKVRKLVLYGGRMTRLNPADGGPLAVPIDTDYTENSRESSVQTLQPQLTEPKVLDSWLAEGDRWDAKGPNGVVKDFQTRMPLSDPKKLTMPCMVVYGAEDFQLKQSAAIAQYFAGLLTKDKTYAIIPDAGHAVHLHRTRERFAKALLGFLDA